MPFIDRGSRVGRSQGASIFWGLVSVLFAAAACFYYLKNHDNERAANQMREQVMRLQEDNENLSSQKEHLQASKAESETQLKTREDLVADKEAQLAQEEARIESLGQQSPAQSAQNTAQTPMVRRFNDAIRKLGKTGPADVVERGGRPVLRVLNGDLFAPGEATLKPEGKALLNQLTVAINGLIDPFELRVVTYTDTDVEADAVTAKPDPSAKPAATDDAARPHYATSWDLTAARAASLGHYYRDMTSLPFKNVLVIGRGDSEPIASNTGGEHARNRRVEITVTPLPVSYRAPDTDKPAATKTTGAKANADASANPAKPKDSSATKTDASDKPDKTDKAPAKKSGNSSSR